MAQDISGGQLALPFLVGAGLALGESLAGAFVGPELPKNNDVAGAGAAIMFYLTFALGFGGTAIVLVLRRMAGAALPERIVLRSCTSVIVGGVIGAASWSNKVPFDVCLAALIIAAIAMAIPWRWDQR